MLVTVNVYGKPWMMTLTPSEHVGDMKHRGTVLVTIATVSGRSPTQFLVSSKELLLAAKAVHKAVKKEHKQTRKILCKLWPSYDWRWPWN